MKLDSKITISELLMHHPSTIDVFIKKKMSCVGCPAETFHTIADAARYNGISLKALFKDLYDAIEMEKDCESP